MWDMHDGWGWWMLIGWIWMVVFWGLIIWAVFAIIGRLGGGKGSETNRSSAMSILEERFARGEIDREQFEEMKKTLAK